MITIKGGDKLDAFLRDRAAKIGRGGTVRIGFLESATYPDGTPVATIAVAQNYGSPSRGIPPRPFFSNMVADKSPGWGEAFVQTLRAANYDTEQALDLLGAGIAGQLREAIVETNSPPLSPITVLLRERFPNHDDMTFADVLQARADIAAGEQPTGNSKPLVWSGVMLAAVDHEVVMA